MKVRMIGPTEIAARTLVVHGRSYTAGPGVILTVPEHDSAPLEAGGWGRIALSGATASRPGRGRHEQHVGQGSVFWDETLGQLIVSDGATWRDPATGAAV